MICLLQCRVEHQVGRVGLIIFKPRSDRVDVVTRLIWKSVEWPAPCNPIDLKSVGLQRAGTIYRSNRIHLRTGIQFDRRILLSGSDRADIVTRSIWNGSGYNAPVQCTGRIGYLSEPDGAMQGQRGTFGFHEQSESTRLKIYFYVTAIWFYANPTLRDYRAATSTWTCCHCIGIRLDRQTLLVKHILSPYGISVLKDQ